MNSFRIALLALALAWAAPSALAATTGSTFNVTTEVQSNCQVTATDMGFGTYDPAAVTERLSTSTLTVTCSLATPYTISLNNGAHASGSTRRMHVGGRWVTYGLYRDVLRQNVFGTAADTLGVSGVGTGGAQVYTVYGAIPAGQNVEPGSYADQVTVTVDY